MKNIVVFSEEKKIKVDSVASTGLGIHSFALCSFAQHYSFKRVKHCCYSFKQSNVSDSLAIWANRSQKTSDSLKKFVFFVCFWHFFPFLCPRANCSCCSSLIGSFLKSDLSNSLTSLFTKEWPERSHNKRASLSNSLTLLFKRMQHSCVLCGVLLHSL